MVGGPPELWLNFPEGKRVNLPETARKFIKQHWQIACRYYYREPRAPQDLESRTDRAVLLGNAGAKLIYEFEKLNIDAPDGRRPISANEAQALVYLLNLYARDGIIPSKEELRTTT